MMWMRAKPYFTDHIIPDLMKGKNVLIVCHGNVMRVIKMHFEKISGEELMKEPVMPNGFPYVLKFDKNMNLLSSELLGDETTIKRSVYLSDGIL